MSRNTKLLLSVFLVLCVASGLASIAFRESAELFHGDSVSSHFLNFGATGKILRQLKVIQPVENKKRGAEFYPNPVEAANRALAERQKLLRVAKHPEAGERVFGYLEMLSAEDDNHFAVLTSEGGQWKVAHSQPVTSKKTIYTFFLEVTGSEVPLRFVFFNKSTLKIQAAVFIQQNYHPLIFSDRFALSRLLSDGDSKRCIPGRGSLAFTPMEAPATFNCSLHFHEKWMVSLSKYQKKQGASNIEYTTAQRHPLQGKLAFTDQQLLDMSKETVPVLSIDVTEEDLYSEDYGILQNHSKHGRQWERKGLVRLTRDGKEVINSFAGIRLHGGEPGRAKGLLNFRIYFRDEYGLKQVDSLRLFDKDVGSIKRLAIKQSEWEEWPLNSPIGYEIVNHLGGIAPPTEYIQFYLNGKHLGQYYIVPHPGEKQINLALPPGEYHYARDRSEPHYADAAFLIEHFWKKYRGVERFDEEEARKYFDLDNLSAQFYSFIYSGTADFCQGVALKEATAGSRMFWYTWDMDHSFIDVSKEVFKKPLQRERWQQHPFIPNFYDPSPDANGHPELCPRVLMFKTLVNSDQQFRDRSLQSLIDVLNYKLTDEYISSLLYKYWYKMDRAGYPHCQQYIGALAEFFRHRKRFLIDQAQEYFATDPFVECRVRSTIEGLQVNGHEVGHEYLGYHRQGETMRLAASEEHGTSILINGRPTQLPSDFTVTASQCEIVVKAGNNKE